MVPLYIHFIYFKRRLSKHRERLMWPLFSWMKFKSVIIQLKVIEQCFMFIMVYKVVQTFAPVDETLRCDH